MELLWAYLALISGLFFAGRDILLKKRLNSKAFDKKDALFFEYTITLLFIFFLFRSSIEFFAVFQFPLLFLAKGILVFFIQLVYFYLLQKYEISLVTPLLNLSPLLLILSSAIFLSEAISLLQFIGILLIIVSTYFLEVIIGHHGKKKSQHMKHILTVISKDKFTFYVGGFLLLLLSSMIPVVDKLLVHNVSVHTNLFYTAVLVVIAMLGIYQKPSIILSRLRALFVSPLNMSYALCGFLSVFLIITAISIPIALVSLIIPIRRTSTLFSSLYGGFLFHEKYLVKKGFAVLFMLVGIVLIVL